MLKWICQYFIKLGFFRVKIIVVLMEETKINEMAKRKAYLRLESKVENF